MNTNDIQVDNLLGAFLEIELSADLLENINTNNDNEGNQEDDDEFIPIIEEDTHENQDGQEDTIEYEDGESEAIAMFQVMKEKGIVSDDADFNGTWEGIDDLINTYLPQKAAEAIIEQAPVKYRTLLAAVYNEGVEPTMEELKSILLAAEADFTETTFTIKTDDDAREYLEKVYEEKGMRKSAIKAQLDDIEDEDKLLEEAKKEYATKEAAREKQLEKVRESQIAKRKEDDAKQAQFIESVKQELVQATWKPERKQTVVKVMNNLPSIFDKVKNSPKGIVQLADFASYYNEKTGTFDMDAYKKQALSPNLRKEGKSMVQSAINNISRNTGRVKDAGDLGNLVPIFE